MAGRPISASYPTVSIVTAHGRQPLSSDGDERLIDLLQRYGVPWSAVSIYVISKSGGGPSLSACLDRSLSELKDASDVLVYFNRNVNPFIFSLNDFKTIKSSDSSQQGTEYFYQRLDNSRSTAEVLLKKLSSEECRFVIAERVKETIVNAVPRGSSIVIGVSGGGDSNALLHALSQITDHELRLHPVIIKGIPDWDAGVPRARQLCESYNLPLTVIEEPDVKALLGIGRNSSSLVDRFEHEFKGDDFEFLGTLLIRLALCKRALELGTTYICTGLNLEDILCENLFRISSGLKPAGIPTRPIGEMKLIFPLWLCPKRIIDGCFPRYSLENYDARYPCFSLGRNMYYSIIYSMQSQFPGFPEQLARGMSELSLKDPVIYTFDEQLKFHVERFVPFPLRQKFLKMIAAS